MDLMSNEAAERRWKKQADFERSMRDQHQPCDSCWMLPEVVDALAVERAAVERIRAAITAWDANTLRAMLDALSWEQFVDTCMNDLDAEAAR